MYARVDPESDESELELELSGGAALDFCPAQPLAVVVCTGRDFAATGAEPDSDPWAWCSCATDAVDVEDEQTESGEGGAGAWSPGGCPNSFKAQAGVSGMGRLPGPSMTHISVVAAVDAEVRGCLFRQMAPAGNNAPVVWSKPRSIGLGVGCTAMVSTLLSTAESGEPGGEEGSGSGLVVSVFVALDFTAVVARSLCLASCLPTEPLIELARAVSAACTCASSSTSTGAAAGHGLALTLGLGGRTSRARLVGGPRVSPLLTSGAGGGGVLGDGGVFGDGVRGGGLGGVRGITLSTVGAESVGGRLRGGGCGPSERVRDACHALP